MKKEYPITDMTLEEKAALLCGKNEWQTRAFPKQGICSICFSDGPNGVRRQAGDGDHLGLNEALPATCFPTGATIANSWDNALAQEVGQALGEEAAQLGVDVLLGPGLNIKRSPLCGRNFEYFSEDPYLSGKLAAAYLRGMRQAGISGCLKHFAVNSQEQRRMAMNAVVDERTLREIYLTGFEIAVKEGQPGAVMSSYNQVNGTYANENVHLLKEILRKEWGYAGIVVTDWGGSNSHTAGVAAGSDLEMPAPGLSSARELVAAVKAGTLSETDVDACVQRLRSLAGEQKETKDPHIPEAMAEKHHQLARKAAAQSAVLLKNDGALLPLEGRRKVAVIGDFAFEARYQGAGSSRVNAIQVDTLVGHLQETPWEVIGCAKGYKRDGSEDPVLLQEAVALAGQAETVIYCFGLDERRESEGIDREDMQINENQILLLRKMREVNENIVGVLSGGSAIEMPWESCCRALLHGYLGGEAGAGAILDLLTGKETPCGKLAETYPFSYDDTPAALYYPALERNAEYREGIYVGYRYYSSANIAVRYPFGYGLSYTEFSYSDLQISEHAVSFTVKNTGTRSGGEIVQLYVELPGAEVFRVKKELKGYQKLFLKPGEAQRVTFPLTDGMFRYWNIRTNRWEEEGGSWHMLIGSSSEDIRLTGTVERKGTGAENPYQKEEIPNYVSGQIRKIKDNEYEKLLGYPVPSGKWSGELTENDAICQLFYAKSALARMLCRILEQRMQKAEKRKVPDLNTLFIYNMPFRAIAKMTEGAVSMEMVHGMVDVVNAHFFRGMRQIFGGYFRNRKENRKYEELLKQQGEKQ